MRVLTALLTATLALPALAAEQTTDTKEEQRSTHLGWNGDWALNFSLNNILVNGSFLGNFQNLGTSGTYFLNRELAVRGGVNFSRTNEQPQVVRKEVSTAGESVVTYEFNDPARESVFNVGVSGDLLWRLRSGAVAPYVGGGVNVGYRRTSFSYLDDVSVVDQSTELNNRTNRLSLGVRGTLGAEWRVHSHFAIFAEYQFGVDIITWNDQTNETIVENTAGGTRTATRTTEEASVPTWLSFGNGLAQGGSLGLIVFF